MVLALPSCLQCGSPARRPGVTFCSRCGLPYGTVPPEDSPRPSCPICYTRVGVDGLIPSPFPYGERVPLPLHMAQHEDAPVGDDDWLETLREGDRIRIGRWKAPFDVVRHYLVTGVVDAGRGRATAHDTIVTAMTQVARWRDAVPAAGDQAEWAEARAAVALLMERYHRGFH
jgi:hypothetical protein